MTKANPGIAYEMWEVLRVMNYQTYFVFVCVVRMCVVCDNIVVGVRRRYRLYGRWAAAYAKYTPLVLARAAAANDVSSAPCLHLVCSCSLVYKTVVDSRTIASHLQRQLQITRQNHWKIDPSATNTVCYYYY